MRRAIALRILKYEGEGRGLGLPLGKATRISYYDPHFTQKVQNQMHFVQPLYSARGLHMDPPGDIMHA